MTPEGRLVAEVSRYLRTRGTWFFKVHGSVWQKAGLPDIIGCDRGRFVGIELKVRPNRPSALQLLTIAKINRAGGVAGVCYSLDDVMALLG